MIALSTRSRARRLAGAALATVLVGVGLGLTASGSIAAPSKIAPAAVKPIFHAQPQAKLIMVADNDKVTIDNVDDKDTGNDSDVVNDGDRDDQASDDKDNTAPPPPPAALPVPPVPPVPAVELVPPVPPVPPVRMNHVMSRKQIVMIHEQVRQAAEQARQAGEMARRQVAQIDFVKLNHDAMIEARTELERECTHAKPAPAGETDQQAIQRLSMGCVDMAEIGREVQEELRKAMEEVRADQKLSEADRALAIATIDRTRAEMAKKFAQ